MIIPTVMIFVLVTALIIITKIALNRSIAYDLLEREHINLKLEHYKLKQIHYQEKND